MQPPPPWSQGFLCPLGAHFLPKKLIHLKLGGIHYSTKYGRMDSSEIFRHLTKCGTMKFFVGEWTIKATHVGGTSSSKKSRQPWPLEFQTRKSLQVPPLLKALFCLHRKKLIYNQFNFFTCSSFHLNTLPFYTSSHQCTRLNFILMICTFQSIDAQKK